MEKIKIDIFGKAPSLAEIERYNISYLFKYRSGLLLSLIFLFIGMPLIIYFMPPINLFNFFYMSTFLFFSIFFSIFFVVFMISKEDRREYFISTDKCINLLELATSHPEIATYRVQIVAQGREFLQSEYDACTNILELKACRQLYGVVGNIPEVKINTTV